MGKVIHLPLKANGGSKAPNSPNSRDVANAHELDEQAEYLVALADQIDAVILEHLEAGIDPKELSGILAHRLGSLMRTMREKDRLFDVCQKVLKQQAAID